MSLIFSAMRKLTDVELQSKQTTMGREQRLTSHTLLLLLRQIPGVISGTWLFAAEKRKKKQPVPMCVRGFLFKTFLNDYRMKRNLEMSHIYGSGRERLQDEPQTQ